MTYQKVFFYSKILAGIATVMVLGVLSALIYQKYLNFRLRRKLKKRFSHAKDGELSAEALLQAEGYQLKQIQKSAKLSMWVNGQEHTYLVRPDAFAYKDGKNYIVEVKTGPVAINPKKSATRRQLLEYYHGFDVDGLLLVDAEKQQINDIYFTGRTTQVTETIERVVFSKKAIFLAFLCGLLSAGIFVYFNSRGK